MGLNSGIDSRSRARRMDCSTKFWVDIQSVYIPTKEELAHVILILSIKLKWFSECDMNIGDYTRIMKIVVAGSMWKKPMQYEDITLLPLCSSEYVTIIYALGEITSC